MAPVHRDARRATGTMATTNAPRGLRVTEKLLRDYRSLQDRYAEGQLDNELHRDPVAERLERRILKACELWPWTSSEVFYWVFAWLHALSYGKEAKTRKRYQGFYGPMPRKRGLIPAWDGVAWVLQHDDLDTFVEELLYEDDRRRYRAVP
jgi:hypothetical protein